MNVGISLSASCDSMLQIYFAEFKDSLGALRKSMKNQLASAFRPGTAANQKRQMSLYLSFCDNYGLSAVNPSVDTICIYVAFLTNKFKSAQSVENYMSGVRFMHNCIDTKAPALDSFELKLMIRAAKLIMRRLPNRRLPFSVDDLIKLVSLCKYMGYLGHIMKVAILFGYYGMLRQSNLAPPSIDQFDITRHTCRGDVIIHAPGLVIIAKWSKTNQSFEQLPLIPIPCVPGSPLDPVKAYNDMLHEIPSKSINDPLLMKAPGKPITVTQLRDTFRTMLELCDMDPARYSLHSLRRTGATMCWHAGVHAVDIQRHGTWSSSAFMDYIMSTNVQKSPVAIALKNISN